MKKRILFIMNPISGTTSKAGIPKLLNDYLDHDQYDYEIRQTQYAGHATELTKEAVAEGFDIVVAVGGDGTVNEVARALVHTPAALGIIPCGSGNGLARHLLIPMHVRKAIEILNAGEIHALDFGEINGHSFFCTCGMGFDAWVSLKFAESGKRGPITYVENVLKEGLKYKPETYILEDETGEKTYKAFLVSVANASQYGNNAYIAPQASMSDGLMDVIIMEPFTVLEAPQIALDLFNKTLDKSSRIKTFRCKQLKIHREQPGVIHYDGDPLMTGADIDINMHAKGINIVVNPTADKRLRKPNAVQTAFAEFFNDLNTIQDDINKQGKKVTAISKAIQRKLNL